MSYRKMVKKMKGMNIKWSDNIFPDYRDISGSYVSNKRINRAKKIVIQILIYEKNRIIDAFKTLAKKRYYNKKVNIKFHIDKVIDRVNTTKLARENDDLYGETDGYNIWVSSIKMSEEELIGTILHESLHSSTTFDNKEICEKDEHYVMRLLGDDC